MSQIQGVLLKALGLAELAVARGCLSGQYKYRTFPIIAASSLAQCCSEDFQAHLSPSEFNFHFNIQLNFVYWMAKWMQDSKKVNFMSLGKWILCGPVGHPGLLPQVCVPMAQVLSPVLGCQRTWGRISWASSRARW